MKTCVRFHPPAYDPGATELFYENMARKGWILTGRGVRLSTFRKEEPQELRYRVEFVPDFLTEAQDMPQEQLALYLDCGWQLAAYLGCIYIFCTGTDNPSPELYSDPREQAETVRAFHKKSRRNLLLLFFFLVPFILWRCVTFPPITEAERFAAAILFAGLILLDIRIYILDELRNALGWSRLYRRLAAGKPIRRDGPRWYLLWRWVSAVMLAVSVALFVYGFSLLAALA